MNLNPVLQTLTTLPSRLKQRVNGMFNLNDPRWGRDDDKSSSDEAKPEVPREDKQPSQIWTSSGAISIASWAACLAVEKMGENGAASAAVAAAALVVDFSLI
jgi:hypothetical protein